MLGSIGSGTGQLRHVIPMTQQQAAGDSSRSRERLHHFTAGDEQMIMLPFINTDRKKLKRTKGLPKAEVATASVETSQQ